MSPSTSRLSRLSLRTRLVAGFVATMLIVLSTAGAFVYWRVEFALDRQLNTELEETAQALLPLVTPSGRLSGNAEVVAGLNAYQVADREGNVLSSDATVASGLLLNEASLRAAADHPIYRDIGELLPISRRPLRVYATSVATKRPGRAAILVVATRRDGRDEALRELLLQLLAAGLGALVITAAVGDRLARAALRPVERYRAQAVEIAAGAKGVRLEVPAGRDDEIARLGHTLNDVLSALEDSVEHERRFINDASHELRTPLTLIHSRVQLARRRLRTVEEHEVILSEIETDVERLARLAEQLLAVGIQQAGANGTGSVDLAELTLRETEQRLTLASPGSPFSAEGALRVEVSGPATVSLSAPQVSQLIGNLLDNAVLHGRPPVDVAVDVVAGTVRLGVSDEGDGMDRPMLAGATKRFARSPEARTRPGSGLGLALVEATVLAAGGQLRLCSQGHHQFYGPDPGVPCSHGPATTVTVLLPPAPSSPLHVPVLGSIE